MRPLKVGLIYCVGIIAIALVVRVANPQDSQSEPPQVERQNEIIECEDTVEFRPIVENTEPEPIKLEMDYEEACREHLPSGVRIPSWRPDGFGDGHTELIEYEGTTNVSTIYYGESENHYLLLRVSECSYVLRDDYGHTNADETYRTGEVQHHLWSTEGWGEHEPATHALWGEGNIAYSVSGTFDMDTLKKIINSMYTQTKQAEEQTEGAQA